MMKKIILILFLFTFQIVNSQDIKVIEGEVISSKMRLSRIVGEFNNQLVTVFVAKKKYFLRTYNASLEVSSVKEISLEYKDNRMNLATVIKVKDRLFVLTTFNNKKSNKTYLLYQEIDPITLSNIKEINILGEIPYESRYDKGGFSIVYSNNQKKILIYHLLPYNKGGNKKIAFTVLDSDLKVLWEKKITLPYADKLFSLMDYELDDEGNVYILGKQYKGKPVDILDKQINFSYLILGYFDEGEEEREYKLAEKDKYITEVRLAVDKDLDLICAGFYSANKSSSSAGGSFYLKIDYDSGDLTTSNYHKFDVDFLTSLDSEKRKAKTKKKASKAKAKGKEIEMINMDLRRLLLNENGNVVLVGEQNYVRVVSSYNASSKSYSTTYYYHYNNIVVVNFNSDGSVKWKRLIPKNQTQTNSSYYLSFVPVVFKDLAFFVYNDHIENSKIEDEVKYITYRPSYKKSELVAYRMDGDGETDRIPLFNALESKIIPVPKQSRQLKESGALILFCKNRKTQKLYRIEFSE